jgi:hypothetical protein
MYRLFPAMPPTEPGIDELFAEALRRADVEFGTMPGLVVSHPRSPRSGPFDSVLCSAVLWVVIEGRSTHGPACKHRGLA